MLETKFKNKGIPVHHNMTRGLDHGSCTLLHRMYPEANIPESNTEEIALAFAERFLKDNLDTEYFGN
jgi:hypothetical protein